MLNRLLPQRRTPSVEVEARQTTTPMSWQAFQNLFSLNGVQYRTDPFKASGAKVLLDACGPAYAVLDRRASILGEARPSLQRLEKGKPTDLFGDVGLSILERPWPGGSWRLLAAIMETDVAACGNSYWVREADQLVRLNPDWVTIVTEEVYLPGDRGPGQVGERLIGYAVQKPGDPAVVLEPNDVAHYRPGAPITSPFRGESWLATVASDASSDVALTEYKGNFLRNGAMPSLAVLYEPTISTAALEEFVGLFADKFTGALNAGKVMHFLGGRDVKTVGATLDQLAFKAVQGAGETRIAAAAGVPAVVAGFSEGMQGSSLNAGNYVATRRLFADSKMRPLLGHAMESLSCLVLFQRQKLSEFNGVRLWYDDSQVSFFQEDVTDDAQIRQLNAQTLRSLIDAGFEPDAAIEAVTTGDFTKLSGQHSGLFSVQLQPPGTTDPAAPAADATPADSPTPPQRAEARDDALPNPPQLFTFNFPDHKVEVQAPTAPAPVVNAYVNVPEQRVDVHVPDQPAPVVNVATPTPLINIDVPEQPTPVIEVNVPEIRTEAPVVNVTVPETQVTVEAPVVNVAAPEAPVVNVRNDIPAPVVDVHVDAPTVNVEAPTVNVDVPARRTKRTVERDKHGRIASVTDEEIDE